MIGNGFLATGIHVAPREDGKWGVFLEFQDAGWCEPGTSEGTLRLRYAEADLPRALDTIKADAERMGIAFGLPELPPCLYVPDGDALTTDEALRATVERECARLGWRNVYDLESAALRGEG